MKKSILVAIMGAMWHVAMSQNLDFYEDFNGFTAGGNTFQGLVDWNLNGTSVGSLDGDAVTLTAGESYIECYLPGGISVFRCEMNANKTSSSLLVTISNSAGNTLYQNAFLTTKNTTSEVISTVITPEPNCTIRIENTTNGGGDKSIIIDNVSWDGFPIYEVQFTNDPSGDSPHTGNTVSVAGTVTGVNGSGFYIQNTDGSTDGTGSGDWSGVFVQNANIAPEVMDFVTITGTVQEINNRTTISVAGTDLYDAQITKPLGGNIPVANLIIGALQEKDESVFSTIQSSRFIADDYSAGNYTMTIGFDATETNNTLIPIDNDIYLTSEPLKSTLNDIAGPVNYDGYFRISPVDGSSVVASGTITHFKSLNNEPKTYSKGSKIMIHPQALTNVRIYNVSGEVIFQKNNCTQMLEVSVISGIYFVSTSANHKDFMQKLMVH